MRTFVDNSGRTWTISVNVGSVKRMRDLAKVDLMGETLAVCIGKLSDDPLVLTEALWSILLPQAEKLGISQEEFAEAIGGEVIANATDALMDEIVDFFPGPKRKIMRRILDRTRDAEKQMMDRMEQMVDSPEVQKKIDETIESVLNSATN